MTLVLHFTIKSEGDMQGRRTLNALAEPFFPGTRQLSTRQGICSQTSRQPQVPSETAPATSATPTTQVLQDFFIVRFGSVALY